MNIVVQIIKTTSELSSLPAIWFGRRIRSLLWYYAISSFVFDILGIYLHAIGNSTRYFSNGFFFLEFIMISIYFSKELFRGVSFKLIIGFIACVAVLFVVRTIDTMRDKTNWEDLAVFDAIMILFCIMALYKVINNIEHIKIEHSPLFIFSASFLLYASACLLLMLFADHFRGMDRSITDQVWSIHNAFNILKNLAIARVFYLQSKSAGS